MGQNILPFYLVCDESGSMDGEPIDAINTALPELHHEIGINPVVADKTQFAIIGFSDRAEVLLPLSNLSQVASLPVLSTKGSTSFGAALRCVKDEIEADVSRLKSEGHQVYRPVVFFLTDGYPNHGENWRDDHQALTSPSFPYHPNIVAFGIGEADPTVISSIATFRAFMSDNSTSPADALNEFAKALTKSIVRSGSTPAGDGGMVLQAPDQVPGFTSLSVDAL
ncbi:VWA domain-containing protein [Nocardioides sp. WL0053]|uniref:VWA domain-containing protein n=1 Tax=Nocardioides jiangsuensis TaxID=2866161 RepID=A0ABS7RLP8_9ACTN|nr:VWA domain-containing protein [Nocardioides jiangsuensis]MBY9075961.1 VWA domain-containing protein [Nocardioides jiangsuensis]